MRAATAEPSGYVFDNDSAHSDVQHRCLAEALDPFSLERLAASGVGEGWRCLDIGTGGGSVARWLARRVGPTGEVVATDVKLKPVPAEPGLRVERHDIRRDPLPDAGFDLIHARLVLQHLPEREAVLARLPAALRPGGWLVLDEFDTGYAPVVVGDERSRAAYRTFLDAKDRVFRDAGGDPGWGRQAAQRMRAVGLATVDPVVRVDVWHGGSAGARLQRIHTYQAEAAFRRAGLTDGQLAEARSVLSDPEFSFTSPVRYWILGRRAG